MLCTKTESESANIAPSWYCGGRHWEKASVPVRTSSNIHEDNCLKRNISTSIVQAWFARRARLPAAMDPEPLTGMFADDALEDGVEAAGVLRRVARYLKW